MFGDEKHQQYTSSGKQWQKLKSSARDMRQEPTTAEQYLWERLRNRQVDGQKFRRQHTIRGFIVDFVCIEQKLVVEVDGSIHDLPEQRERDTTRQAIIENAGFKVLRFTNEQVLTLTEDVISQIKHYLA